MTAHVLVGDELLVEHVWTDGSSEVEALYLPAVQPLADRVEWLAAPWLEVCEGCDGTCVEHAGTVLAGPCAACWGTGRMLFAFRVDEPLAAFAVPAPVAAPYQWLHFHGATA